MSTDFDADAAAGQVMEATSGRLQVRASGRNPVDIADDVVAYLMEKNEPPALFRMGDRADGVVRVNAGGGVDEVDSNRWLYLVARLADFTVTTKEGTVKIVGPPETAMRIIPAAALDKLPVLDGVTNTPYLLASGRIVNEDGYNAESRLFLHAGTLRLPAVSEAPSPQEVAQARDLLLNEWLGDFPFATTADRANALALLLTRTGRVFTGNTPLTVVDASTPGSGKGLLVYTTNYIATGEAPKLQSLPTEEEEQRKKVTSLLLSGNDLIVWDESHVISGRTLAMILTADVYSDRLLGGNKMIAVKNRILQVAIGNNVQVYGDMKRRVVPVRLEPDCEHPENRADFRHPDLARWVRDNRADLLAAVLTLWRAWIAAGKPRSAVTMGSFERWASVIGGVLDVAGIGGFMSATDEWLDDSDPDTGVNAAHLAELHAAYGGAWFSAKDVVARHEQGYMSRPPVRGAKGDERPMAERVGILYRTIRDRWYDGLRLEAGKAPKGIRQYRVTVRDTDAAGGPAAILPPTEETTTTHPNPPQPESGQNGHGVGVGGGGLGSKAPLAAGNDPGGTAVTAPAIVTQSNDRERGGQACERHARTPFGRHKDCRECAALNEPAEAPAVNGWGALS